MKVKERVIDTPQSNVSFSIKKLGFLTIKGTLADIQGSIAFDENNLENSNFDVSVSPLTISTGNAKRDEDLKSNHFFYVRAFPKISFTSTSIIKENEEFIAAGALTLLNKTKMVRIRFTLKNKTLISNFTINRLDYELGKKFPAIIVGKSVQININSKIK